MMGITHINRITIQAENENVIDQVQGEVEQLLRQRHKIKAGDDDDFTVRNLAALMETMMETANTITLLLGCIAAISLLRYYEYHAGFCYRTDTGNRYP